MRFSHASGEPRHAGGWLTRLVDFGDRRLKSLIACTSFARTIWGAIRAGAQERRSQDAPQAQEPGRWRKHGVSGVSEALGRHCPDLLPGCKRAEAPRLLAQARRRAGFHGGRGCRKARRALSNLKIAGAANHQRAFPPLLQMREVDCEIGPGGTPCSQCGGSAGPSVFRAPLRLHPHGGTPLATDPLFIHELLQHAESRKQFERLHSSDRQRHRGRREHDALHLSMGRGQRDSHSNRRNVAD